MKTIGVAFVVAMMLLGSLQSLFANNNNDENGSPCSTAENEVVVRAFSILSLMVLRENSFGTISILRLNIPSLERKPTSLALIEKPS